MMHLEVADADCADFAVFVQLFKSTPCVFIFILAGPMNQIKIEVIEAEALKVFSNASSVVSYP